MKLTNPNPNRPILATVAGPDGGRDLRTVEIEAGGTYETDDYVLASTLMEYGAIGEPVEVQAATEAYAAQNRATNSRVASASASEGRIVQRRQATVDVATGTTDADQRPLTGSALDAAVRAANEAGATIPVSGTADDRRAALATWQASAGTSTPVQSEEYVLDGDGELILDDDDQPFPADEVEVDEDGEVVFGDDGRPIRLAGDGSGEDSSREE